MTVKPMQTNKRPKARLLFDFLLLLVFILGGLSPLKTSLIKNIDTDLGILDNYYLVNIFSNFRFQVLKDVVYNAVLVGPNHWLNYIGENSLDDYQNSIPFTEDELATIQANLDTLQQKLAAKNIQFYIFIPPNKTTIYPEKMPEQIIKLRADSRLDQLVEYQKTHGGIDLIDLVQPLLAAKQDYAVYKSTDSHWSPYGAWVGYSTVIEKMAADFPEIIPLKTTDFNLEEKVISNGDLAKIAGNLKISESVLFLNTKDKDRITYDKFYENGVSYTTSEITGSDLPRAVVFRDSFFSALQPYFAEHFSYAIYAWTATFDWDLIDEVKPDIVIIALTERALRALLSLR